MGEAPNIFFKIMMGDGVGRANTARTGRALGPEDPPVTAMNSKVPIIVRTSLVLWVTKIQNLTIMGNQNPMGRSPVTHNSKDKLFAPGTLLPIVVMILTIMGPPPDSRSFVIIN